MRNIMVGTRVTRSTRCCSTRSRNPAASKRRIKTTLQPPSRPWKVALKGAAVVDRTRDEHGSASLEERGGILRVVERLAAGHDQLGETGAASRRQGALGGRDPFGQWAVRERWIGGEASGQTGVLPGLLGLETEDEGRVGELQEGVALGGRMAIGEEIRDGAELPGREGSDDQVDSVREAETDPIPGLHTARREDPGQAVGVTLELAEVEGLVLADQRDPLRMSCGEIAEPASVGAPGHRSIDPDSDMMTSSGFVLADRQGASKSTGSAVGLRKA